MRSRLFFVLSGEHPTLPSAEVKSILDAHRLQYTKRYSSSRLLRLVADDVALVKVLDRSLMCVACGVELFTARLSMDDVHSKLGTVDFKSIMRGGSFAVRVQRLGPLEDGGIHDKMKREIGSYIRSEVPGVKVDLDRANVEFIAVISQRGLLFGYLASSKSLRKTLSRRPRRRPSFHPSTVHPKVARIFVNLARPPPNGTLLDPFCGVGGILIEASMVGCEIIGIDLDNKMMRGAAENLKFFGASSPKLLVADARRIPIREVDCIATDPPYGRSASTHGFEVRSLMAEFLSEASLILKSGSHICIAAPVNVRLHEIAQGAGFKILESHEMRAHKSLTREILVLKK